MIVVIQTWGFRSKWVLCILVLALEIDSSELPNQLAICLNYGDSPSQSITGDKVTPLVMSKSEGNKTKQLQPQKKQEEVPWDMVDRLLLPVVFSHAAAVILSSVLNTLYISQVSMLTLFFFFLLISVGSTLFYHNLKVQ